MALHKHTPRQRAQIRRSSSGAQPFSPIPGVNPVPIRGKVAAQIRKKAPRRSATGTSRSAFGRATAATAKKRTLNPSTRAKLRKTRRTTKPKSARRR